VRDQTLGAYRSAPKLVEEHVNIEQRAVEGGYGRRQLFELIQNGADELLGSSGRIEVVLTEQALYCANEGRPLSREGITALLFSNLSAKTGPEIGRFGLGFKSVLGVSTTPEIFSRSGSVRFDRDLAESAVASVLGRSVERVPTLRLAKPLDPARENEEDPELAALMEWASTVVRLRRDVEDTTWLSGSIRDFPAEFLLFSPHVEELVLRDRVEGTSRSITARQDGDVLRLAEGSSSSDWRVFRTVHTPSAQAKRDGGTMAMRDEVPLVWAVPLRFNRDYAVGSFWAFFPTYERTTLSGILNAPWKLSEDRARLIEKSPFNQELIEALCDLVLDNLDQLTTPEDPALLLDLLPARGRELRGWADQIVTESINDVAGFYACVPDQLGVLQLPAAMHIHPQNVPREALEIWASAPGRPIDWAHPTVETRDRRAKLEIYFAKTGTRVAGMAEWLEALTRNGEVTDSGFAVRAGAAVIHAEHEDQGDVEVACIVADESGVMRCPDPSEIFLPAPNGIEAEVHYVNPDLLRDEAVRQALTELGIRQVDALRVLHAYVLGWSRGWQHEQWDAFWDLVRRCADPGAVSSLMKEQGFDGRRLMVRTRAGGYARLIATLLPGDVVSERSVEDADATIDVGFHAQELTILKTFGASPSPTTNGGRDDEPWFDEYQRDATERYLDRIKGSGAAPNRQYLGFRRRPFAGPSSALRLELSNDARCRLTHALLQASSDLDQWTFCHLSQSRYPELAVDHPLVWLIRGKGLLRTSLGPARVDLAVGPDLADFQSLLPVAQGLSRAAARALRLPSETTGLSSEHWSILFTAALKADDDRTVARAYVTAVTEGQARPATLRCRMGVTFDEQPPDAIAVTADREVAQLLRRTGEPHLVVPRMEDARALVAGWGLRSEDDAVRSELRFIEAGEEEPLIDLFPILRHKLTEEQARTTVLPCSELRTETFTDLGTTSTPRMLTVDGPRILRHVELQDADFLEEISSKFGLNLTDAQIQAILQNVEDHKTQQLRESVRAAEDDVERLLLAVGVSELRSRIPASLIAASERINSGSLEDSQIAQLALAVHGLRVLEEYRDVLGERNLNPPVRWAGGRKAVSFVTELGFGPEFAGFENLGLQPSLEVEGTPDIPPLHDFQVTVVADIRDLLRGNGSGLRGLLSLPTGAGKTRVTVQALIEAIVVGELSGTVLWIAQTEELCEQAVQTWSELWRGIGPQRRLTVSRLWSRFDATSAEYGEQVVVATIQKLEAAVYGRHSYQWLRDATQTIVVDEAHSSIGRSYTEMLEWLDMARNVDRIPLIGLTATPFRNTSVEETKRLVARYGHRRLDANALGTDDAYPRLQELGILSRVDHRTLAGQEMKLTPEELERLRTLRQLSARVTQKLGEDVDRNRTLLDDIGGLDPEWPVLLFAASVEHAQIMAALLTREGISAAAITGETNRGARRHYIKQFKSRELRVLTNFNVLTAGFDAPEIRALYIARPTYSPNAYQQMVGRGLRGPRNGGTDRCLLVNVEDNVANFGEELAFHEFNYLWADEGIAAG
jgi:superfamily II DNA or RNA helicase